MAMTATQKILSAASGGAQLSPGDLIEARLSLCMANDITAPIAIRELEKLGLPVFDREKVALVLDHFTPAKDIKSAAQCAVCRDFARKEGISHFFEGGEAGIEHALLPEKGLVKPGDVIIGADSHTCTYGALGAFAAGVGSTDCAAGLATGRAWFRVPEAISVAFSGRPRRYVSGKDAVLHLIGLLGVDGASYMSLEFSQDIPEALSMDDRFTVCNMAVEAGAKNGIFPVDGLTREYLYTHVVTHWKEYTADADAGYARKIKIDLSELEPTVALPHLPSNIRPARECINMQIQQAVIGSCTNGRISDLRAAAAVLKGRRAAPGVRLIVIPATPAIYRQAMREGLTDIFLDAGAVISPPTCGPCLGGHMGVLSAGERCISTTNRNFVGRMGEKSSEVCLSNPAVAAASAVAGYIISPEDL